MSAQQTEQSYLYSTISVLVDGALDAEQDFGTPEDAQRFIAEQIAAAQQDSSTQTEIFELIHDHALSDDEQDAEDVCAQYAQDHRPIFSSAQSTDL